MPTELKILGWSILLAFAYIFAPTLARLGVYGAAYNVGSRDTPPSGKPTPLVGRLERAQANFFETFPLFAAALLGCVLAGHAGGRAALGSWLYLGARAVYLPIYAAGIPVVRTMVFAVSAAGIGLLVVTLLT